MKGLGVEGVTPLAVAELGNLVHTPVSCLDPTAFLYTVLASRTVLSHSGPHSDLPPVAIATEKL
jgi:hypothetical protein